MGKTVMVGPCVISVFALHGAGCVRVSCKWGLTGEESEHGLCHWPEELLGADGGGKRLPRDTRGSDLDRECRPSWGARTRARRAPRSELFPTGPGLPRAELWERPRPRPQRLRCGERLRRGQRR